MHRPLVVLQTGAPGDGVSHAFFRGRGAGVRAADDADDDALVSLHTCCEAISEARFWSSAAFSVLGTVSVKRGWGTVQCCLPFPCGPLNVMTSVSCLVLCVGFSPVFFLNACVFVCVMSCTGDLNCMCAYVHVMWQCACTTCECGRTCCDLRCVCVCVCVLLQKLTFREAVGQWCSAKLLDSMGGSSC